MGKRPTRTGNAARWVAALCCLLALLWALPSATVHVPGPPSERQPIMVMEHGHAHSPAMDLLWAMHGHSHEVMDHDHSPAIPPLASTALPVREPVTVVADRVSEGGPATVYRIERPPRG